MPSVEVEQGARANGISEATLRLAKKALGVRAIKKGQPGNDKAPGKWYLKLPDEAPEGAKNPEGANANVLAPSTETSAFGESEEVGRDDSGVVV